VNIYVCDGVSECVHTEQAVFRALCFFTYGGFRVHASLRSGSQGRGGDGKGRRKGGGGGGGGGPGYLSAEVVARSQNISVSITWDKALIHCVIQKLDWNF
jgi:hypothetical protein